MIASSLEIAPEAVAAHYDDLDYFYRDVWGEHVHHGLWLRGDESREEAVRQLVQLVAREARIERDSRVCDIGCGYGATARMLAAELDAEVTAITVSAAQHAFARAAHGTQTTHASRVTYLLGDWLANDLAAASFDAAIAIESSEHMPDLTAFFQQAARVLKPDGRLVVCAWLSAEQPTRNAIKWLLEPICREGRMPQLATSGEYQSLAAAAGFRMERFEDITRGVRRTWSAIVRRLLVKFVTAPRFLRFLFTPHAQNRIFALTILRIWVAYRISAMRYGVFTLVKR